MFKSFLLENLVSLLMKIMNSVVVVGLYYGFLTTFSIGPSYLFLLRAGVMEEGTEKKVAATTGFLIGQLIMFISIYYAPLHLALGRPHTITVIALPYLFFHFFCNRPQYFLNNGDIRKNTLMRNLSIQMIFLNNLLFPLLNLFILPSSILVRLIHIYMFRSNNKILFLTSSFVSWLIGQILFIKSVGFLLDWIQQNNYIQKNVFKRSNKYIMYQVRYYMPRIFTILLCIICLYDLGRTPVPILNPFFNKKVKKISEPQEKERGQIEEQQEQNRSAEEDFSPSLFSEENKGSYKIDETEKKEISIFEKPLVTTLFDYNQWYRPLRYIKNDRFENDVRNEMSQYFFYTCQSDGKERISFTYPPSLSTFVEMMQKKMSLFTTEKISYDELYNCWNSTNEQKKNNLSSELLNRFKVLDKKFLDRLEKRSRLSNDKTKQKYLPRIYDPFLNGSYRGQIKNEIDKKNDIWRNRNKGILLNINSNSNYPEYEQISIDSEENQFLFVDSDKMITDPNDQTIVNRKKLIGKNKIKKKLPRWSYRLIDEFEEMEGEIEEIEKNEEIVKEEEEEENEKSNEGHDIRSREYRRLVIFTDDIPNSSGEQEEIAVIDYPYQPDFRRELIKGSMRAQRRKTVIGEFLQSGPHSPLFLDKTANLFVIFFDDILEPISLILQYWIGKDIDQAKKEKILDRTAEQIEEFYKEEMEERRIKVSEDWDNIHFGQEIRGCLLVTQSIFRKYIRVPLLIITKNIVRILLFQTAEWSEDLNDWKREIHIRCTYNGIPLSETEFPKNWLTEGIQIKVLFPFRLKPWHKSKPEKHQKTPKMDFFFLTILGTETEVPFGSTSPRKRFDFFDMIFKEIIKRMKKGKKKFFLGFKMKNERTKWIIKKILFVKEKIKKLKKIFLFGLRQRYELSETQKDSTITNNNQMIYESSISIQSINWTNSSLTTEEKIKDLKDRTFRIINEIDKSTNDNKKGFILPEMNISSNKATSNNKRLDLQKNIWQLLKRKNVRLVRKSHYFLKLFIERAYFQFFIENPAIKRYLCIINIIINISRKYIPLFLESTKEKINKYISNNKTNESLIHFCSTIQKSISNTIANISNTNSQIFFDVSSLSQAYVFYKLSQNPVYNSYKHRVRSVFKDDGTYPILTNRVQDNLFGIIVGIKGVVLHSKLICPTSSVMNQWLNWLNGHYQYNLSQNRWSRLVPKKWRNRINERGMDKNKDFKNWDSYEKNQFYKKQEQKSLLIKKKLKKQYAYDFLAHKSMNYAYKKDSLTYYEYIALGKALDNHRFYGMSKQKLFDNIAFRNFIEDFIYIENTQNTGDIPIQNYLGDIIYMEKRKNMDRKYFDWRIMNFCRRNKMDMEIWVDNDYYLTSHEEKEINPSNEKKIFFDWMGMNVEIINNSISISVLRHWFFSKFLIFYNEYRSNPWGIPIKLLFFNFHFNGNRNSKISENKSITKKKKLELETRNQRETEYAGQVDLESSLSTQEKDFENDVEWDMKKEDKKQKKSKNKIEEELDFFLKRYWGYQLDWNEGLDEKIMSNIKLSGLMLRASKNLREIVLGYLQRRDLNLDVLGAVKNQKNQSVLENGLLVIKPMRLFRKNDGKFIMYQTIGPSLIHKSKHQFHQNQIEREKSYSFYSHINNFDEAISRHHKMTEKKEQKHYDFLVPENILSSRRRRELRILMCLTYRNRNTAFYNEDKVNNCCQVVLGKSKEDRDKQKQIYLKFFLWPNYRLEDLACMNRYWFDTNNGSRFSMLRIHMYPRLKIR
uniref:Protein TIC 214 n=1 Tax=Barklya syringifolia TaxID=162678 RepID=A0A2S0ST25_9FABA|nr:hypothetical protein RF1 [Barklya syringifolia]AWB12659.1 hypothetical protein RF1 [Barklya syringifolia]